MPDLATRAPPGREPRRAIAWIQSTGLGVDARVDRDNLVARATRLDGGAPAAGVALELQPHGITATTDDQGMATLPLDRTPLGASARLVASDRGDVAMVDVAQPYTDAERDRPQLAWYYRIAMTYAAASPGIAPADHGFAVARRYEVVDDPGDVRRAADGTWHIRAGARVRIRVSLVNDRRRYHVALVDPLPAGLEILDRTLATAEDVPDAADGPRRDRGWYEHQNLRDDRAEAFAGALAEGVHDYDYVARATTPGSFAVPPSTAEEMYMPETSGRGAGDRVVIE